jgi:PAS domain S-box-containing protein
MSVFLIIVAQYSFLGFHTLAELFAIVISFTLFAFAWSTYGFSKNNFLLFLACGYFWIGSLDLVHTLSYKGMNIFVEGSGNLSVQFWIGTRYSEALLLLVAPFAAARKQNGYLLLTTFGAIAIGLTILVFSGYFPTGFIEGKGLTDFKIYSEYLIDFILALALISLFRHGRDISTEEKVLIAASIVMTMFAELAFTFYVSVYGLSNLAGHIFKLFSFWFIFHAIVVHNLKNPYASLQRSEEKFRQMAETIEDVFWMADPEKQQMIYISPAYEKIWGRSCESLYQTPLSFVEAIIPEDRERIKAAFSDQAKGTYDVEFRINHPDGTQRVINDRAFPIHDDEGNVISIVGFAQDITERKHLEEILNQSQKMEAIGQLTGGVAHDFNNLLGVMLGNTEMLGDMIGSDKNAKQNIDEVKKAIDRAASLTNRLLAFSRQQKLSPVATDITDLVTGLEDMLRRTLGETIDLRVVAGPGLWPATIDRHQFENALINLAINSRDAMPLGGSLTIETANISLDETYAAQNKEVSPGDYVKVAVSDTGTGMPPEILDKVFEPFFTTKEVGKGSGLGLSMVYGFARQSQGHITIYSEEGHGATIKLYMPRSPDSVSPKVPRQNKPVLSGGSEHILVIEDDEDLRIISTSILRKHGYQVTEAGNGEQAIIHLKGGQPFDLLFTDLILPGGMNGMEIAEKAKGIQPGIKILYTTGYAENSLDHQGRQGPDKTLVNKPYRRKDLLTKVRTVLDSKQS